MKNERAKNENKNKTQIDPKQSTQLQQKCWQSSTKENSDNSEDSSSIKSRDINSKNKKLIVPLGDGFNIWMAGKCQKKLE